MDLTAVQVKVSEGYSAFVEELPGANAQGADLEEAKENLKGVVELILAENRRQAKWHFPPRCESHGIFESCGRSWKRPRDEAPRFDPTPDKKWMSNTSCTANPFGRTTRSPAAAAGETMNPFFT
jgi:hypothetical protein